MRLGMALRSGLALLVFGLALPAAASSNLSFRWTRFDVTGSSAKIVTFGSFAPKSISFFTPQQSFKPGINDLSDKKGGLFGKLETLKGDKVIGSSNLHHTPSLKEFAKEFSKGGHSFRVKRVRVHTDHKDRDNCRPGNDQPIPEPSAALLFAVGGGVVALRLRTPRRLA